MTIDQIVEETRWWTDDVVAELVDQIVRLMSPHVAVDSAELPRHRASVGDQSIWSLNFVKTIAGEANRKA